MNLKKIVKLMAATAILSTVGVAHVSAASTVKLTCAAQGTVKPGQSTTCTVSVTPDSATIVGKTVDIGVYTSDDTYLETSYLEANSIWTNTSKSETDTKNKEYAFTYAGTENLVNTKAYDVFSFKVTVKSSASSLSSNASCGSICVANYDATGKYTSATDACYAPSIFICTGDDCEENPKTGAFEDTLLVMGCTVVGLLAVAVISKKNKFYRV